MELSGKRVLITGAARGIGAETARVLAGRGARLSVVGLEPAKLEQLAGELGSGHVFFEADVADQAALDAAVAGTVESLGGIDVVIANAGIAPFGTIANSDTEVDSLVIDVNLTGVIRTVRSTASQVGANGGYYLLISSVAAFTAVPGVGVYAATKAGVESLANTIRVEFHRQGVGVGSAHPSWIDTDLVRDAANEFEAFRLLRAKLPWPLKSTTSVEACAEALADGIEKRKRRIYVPRSIALVARSRRLLNGPLGERFLRRRMAKSLDMVDFEVAEHGPLSTRTREIERTRG